MTMHPSVQDLEALLRGTMEAERLIEVSSHTETCAACARELAWLRAEQDLFAQRARGVPPSEVWAQIEAQMEMMNRQLNEQMAHLNAAIDRAGLSAEESERIIQRARERSERAAAQAQEKVRRAQEQIERKIESTRRREEQRNQSWGARFGRGAFHVNFPPTPPVPPKEAVSNEERLVILRMLEQKKISLEDAEQLLAALEGKES